MPDRRACLRLPNENGPSEEGPWSLSPHFVPSSGEVGNSSEPRDLSAIGLSRISNARRTHR